MRDMKFLKHMPWVVLFVLLAAGSVLWLLFVREQRSHVDEVFQYETERLADELVRLTLQGQWPVAMPAPIVGFGLYGPRGEGLKLYGQAPQTQLMPPPRAGEPHDGRSFQDSGEGLIDFVKRLDRPPGPMADPDDMMRGPRMGGASLFLRLRDDELTSRALFWNVGAFVGPLVWAGFLGFVGWLWHRSRKYQDALNNNRELLQFAEAAKTLSHEIKNPLAAILLQTALLKRGAGAQPPQEITIIEEETQRISHLVSRVRDFLRDPSGQPEVQDLASTVKALLDRFEEPLALSGADGGPYGVRFDPHRLRSVLENLFKNAVESGRAPRPEILLSRPRAGWVRLEVIDHGDGFSPSGLKQAATPFFTTKVQGSGIGLSITDSFVKAAGGTLKWENRHEGGARVWIDLPEVKGEGGK